MIARVLDAGKPTDSFPVTNGVKQGCLLATKLLSTMFSAMFINAFRNCDASTELRYRFWWEIVQPQASRKVKQTVIRDLLFADDCTLDAATEQKMLLEVDKLSTASESFGLTISTMMIEVMFQPALGNPHQAPYITVKDSASKQI